MEEKYKEFNSTTFGKIHIGKVIFLIKSFLEEEPQAKYNLVIGTDSHERMEQNGKKSISLITAVIVHRKGFGGRYFWVQRKIFNVHNLRQKIYAETFASLEFAEEFLPLLRKELNGDSPSYDLEIHIDVGEHGDTRDMIKEVVGIVTGSGFVAKTKPHAFGASYVADKHT